MDIQKSITFVPEDERWFSKLLIGALVSYVPILNLAWLGYITDLMRNVSQGNIKPLPEWEDFGEKFTKGLIVAAAGAIYSLPVLLLGFVPFLALVVSEVSSGSDFEEALTTSATGVGLVFLCCIALYMLILSFFFPAVHVNFSRLGTFKACFQIREILSLVSANLGNYLIAWVVSMVGGFAIGLIAGLVVALVGWLPCIGWIIAWIITSIVNVWITAFYAHLFGQVGATPSLGLAEI